MHIFNDKIFTSDLSIYCNEVIKQSDIHEVLKIIDDKWNIFNTNSEISKLNERYSVLTSKSLIEFLTESDLFHRAKSEGIKGRELLQCMTYNRGMLDLTAVLKGYAISLLIDYLYMNHQPSFLINFGGDIVGSNWFESIHVGINESMMNATYILQGTFSLFTSGNYSSRRGIHIKYENKSSSITSCAVAISDKILPITADLDATLSVSSIGYEHHNNIKITRYNWEGIQL